MSRLLHLVLACLGILCLWKFGGWAFSSFVGKIEPGSPAIIRLDQSLTHKEVAQRLQDEYRVVNSALGYRIYTAIARSPKAKPGTYQIQPGTRYSDIAPLLARGPQRAEREVRVIEGWDLRNQADQLAAINPAWRPTFLGFTGQSGNTAPFDPKWRAEFPFLQSLPADRSLEGYLFPDTYRVWEDELPESLIRKQLSVFDQRVYQIFKDMPLPAPLKTFDEAVILASIVEKEVQTTKDRAIVAGLFLRRLQEGMALQSDATLTYITGSNRGRATAEELRLETAYNSYKNRGLPPGPIAHPALSALQAVFNPTKTPYRYFLTDKQNNVLYAATFEDHIRNRQRAGY
ncbi:endolytic transglycosylase MltG [Patescibacteria group bacterium]|nr:endolytic transglycosylase MltG [Patescibacteria group bacterium]MBP9710362.1 endolytic transglycosylase MltG [Patescibacteria group bacterium]